jgi:hypothetical protein
MVTVALCFTKSSLKIDDFAFRTFFSATYEIAEHTEILYCSVKWRVRDLQKILEQNTKCLITLPVA